MIKFRYILICSMVLLFAMACVCAEDNITQDSLDLNSECDDSISLHESDINVSDDADDNIPLSADDDQVDDDSVLSVGDDSVLAVKDTENSDSENETENKTLDVPSVSISSSKVYTGSSIKIYLKDSNNTPISSKILLVKINNKIHKLKTNSAGKVSLNLDLKSKKYNLQITFEGDEDFRAIKKTFKISVLKLDSRLKAGTKRVVTGKYFNVLLRNQKGAAIANVNVLFKVKGKTHAVKTNSKGKASFKVKLKPGSYPLNIKYKGNGYYNGISKKITLRVPLKTSILIGNKKILTKGYLRVYLKSAKQSAISKKIIKITVGKKTFSKRTNSEGIAIIKPKVGVGKYKVTATYKGSAHVFGSYAEKIIKGVKGKVKNPLKTVVHLKNRVPDVDSMPKNFVLANDDLTYTLSRAQYMSVIKRDSLCLYLNKKLSKYTIFKSKSEPKVNHIIKREKWNVIERAVNTKIVKKNTKGYWPSKITVSLKGKSYTYSEVRDKQNTEYTCAPTSGSMCSQALRCYVCEKQLARQAGTVMGFGTKCQWIKSALEKNHFKCSYFTRGSYHHAINELKKGGCALIFHANNHYVAIIDISKDGKKVLVSNSYGRYDAPGAKLPNKWLTVKYVKTRFCSYDSRSLIVKLKYNIYKSTAKKVNIFYKSMGTKWARHNTSERLLDVGL